MCDLYGDVLDFGVQDVMKNGFDGEEMVFRISKFIQYKCLLDCLCDNFKYGLQVVVIDFLMGLFNCCYVMIYFVWIVEQVVVKGG